MKAQIIAQELKEKGFSTVAIPQHDIVIVSLKNRKVSTMEVAQAVDEIGFDFPLTSTSNAVQIKVD